MLNYETQYRKVSISEDKIISSNFLPDFFAKFLNPHTVIVTNSFIILTC
jgi:hypothetical protein